MKATHAGVRKLFDASLICSRHDDGEMKCRWESGLMNFSQNQKRIVVATHRSHVACWNWIQREVFMCHLSAAIVMNLILWCEGYPPKSPSMYRARQQGEEYRWS